MALSVCALECESCHHKFTTNQSIINCLQHKRKYDINGQPIFLTFFDCPECSKRHFVQIDNASTLAILKNVTDQFGALCRKRAQGKPIPQKQSDKFNRLQQHLTESRKRLVKEYTGVSIHDEATDSDFVLRFSI